MPFLNNLNNARKFIPHILKEKERKSIVRIIIEIIYLLFIQCTFPTHYFSRRLYLKDSGNIHDYIPNKLLFSLSKKFNDSEAINLLDDKYFFYLFFKQFNINIAHILIYNHKNTFFLNNKIEIINNPEDFESIIKKVIYEYSLNQSIIIKKTYGSYGGRNIYKLSKTNLPLNKNEIILLFKEITSSSYIIQDTIIQHSELNKINDSCVNTIRIDTFTDKTGKVEIMSAFLRMSISGSHVDNVSAGGCFIGINLETGKLKKIAYTTITRTGGQTFEKHPKSKLIFKDYLIPYFEDAKDLVIKAAKLIPNIRLIGWDVGIQPDGPVIIEGNNNYDITINDLIYGGYRKNPVFQKLLDEIK